MIRRLGTALIVAAALVSCSDDPGADRRTTVDSAGVTIVTSSVPVWGDSAAWHLDSIPTLSIGDASRRDAPLLIDVSGVRLLSDGRIAVVSNEQKAVLYFGVDGAPAGRTGKQGTGAGEFLQVMLVGAAGDSLLLWDSELDRATLLTPAGAVARSFPLVASDSTARYGFAPAGRFADGGLLVAARVGATLGQASGVRREPVPLHRASPLGVVGEMVITVPGNEQLVVSTDRYVSSIPRAFGPRTLIGVGDDRVFVATGAADQVHVLDRKTSPGRIWRIDRAPRRVDSTDAAVQSARHEAQASQLPAEFATAMRRALAEAGTPATLPAFDQLLVDGDGAVWLRDDIGSVRRGSVQQHWTVFDRRGRWLGTVVMPSGFTVHQIARDRVIGVWTDPDGVEQVHIYALHR